MPTSIARALADSSTRYSQRAVEAFIRNEYTDFYLTAGIALEQAMKARLAREHITFIAPDRAFKSSVALSRTQEDVSQLPVGTKTVGGAEAFRRVVVTELDAALDAFLGDIDAANHGNDVLVASISEFGRRAAQNTDGLDHGTTSVMFLAGAANGGIYGQSPNWGALDANGNLVSPISLADYYATLAHWLGVTPASVLPVSGNPIAGVVS